MANYEEYDRLMHERRLTEFRSGLNEMARQAKGKPFTFHGSYWTMNREGQLLGLPLSAARQGGRGAGFLGSGMASEGISAQDSDMPIHQPPIYNLPMPRDITEPEK